MTSGLRPLGLSRRIIPVTLVVKDLELSPARYRFPFLIPDPDKISNLESAAADYGRKEGSHRWLTRYGRWSRPKESPTVPKRLEMRS